MGLGDLLGKVITEYKADTSDHKAKIKELSGLQKKAAQEQLKDVERQNKAIDGHVEMLGKIGVAMGGIAAAYAIGKAGFDQYAETVRLRAASSKVDIEVLAKASRGLVKDTDLLRLAAAGASGAWKLNEGQIELVVEAMGGLRKEGHANTEILNVLTETLQKGETDGLKKFGIAIKQNDDASVNLGNVLTALGGITQKYGDDVELAADRIERASVRLNNAWDTVKNNIGRSVVWVGDTAAEGLDAAGGLFNSIGRGGNDPRLARIRSLTGKGMGLQDAAGQVYREDQDLSNARTGKLNDPTELARLLANVNSRTDAQDAQRILTAAIGRALKNAYEVPIRANEFAKRYASQLGATLKGLEDPSKPKARRGGGGGGGGDYVSPSTTIDLAPEDGNPYYWLANKPQFGHAAGADITGFDGAGAAASAGERNQSRLAEIFGPVSDFDAYATGFQLLETAVSSAFDAWMTGAKGVGEAMKMAVAKWGAVAVAAGVVAKGLGGSSSAGAGASAGGYRAVGASGGDSGGGGRTVNIVMDGGNEGSPRANARRVARALFTAEQHGYSARPPGVEFS